MRHLYATYTEPDMAEKAGGALLDHGVKAASISIVFPEGFRPSSIDKGESSEHSENAAKSGITTTTMGDAQVGAARGAGIGLAAGTLAALAAVFIPGIGLVLGGGALALALGGMAGSAAAGAVAGGVTGFMVDQGVPVPETAHFEEVLRTGGALVTVSPTNDEPGTPTIESILAKYGGTVSSHVPTAEEALLVSAGTIGYERGGPMSSL